MAGVFLSRSKERVEEKFEENRDRLVAGLGLALVVASEEACSLAEDAFGRHGWEEEKGQ